MKAIYIYGVSGHGLVVADVARACGYDEIVLIDDRDSAYPSLSDISPNQNIPLVLGLSSNQTRKALFSKLKAEGYMLATLIHPTATLSPSASVGQGTVIMPQVVVNAQSHIGDGVILNTNCVIEHECRVENFAHISPSVSLARNVAVNELVHIGIGASVIQSVCIGKESIVGAGSVVVSDIPPNTVAFGVPCKVQKNIHTRAARKGC